jgi:predicted alpha/beta-hydrolase family hydrolase
MTDVVETPTRSGPARWHLDRPPGTPRAILALGHGAGGGVDANDLKVVAAELSRAGVVVARFEQPWRVAGRRVAPAGAQLDAAWGEAVNALPAVFREGLPILVGGRSAGARVACRTAVALGAVGVVALAFPLHPPGRPDRSRADELPSLPVLVVQGDRDAFGSSGEVRAATAGVSGLTTVRIPDADHALRVSRRGPLTQVEADEIVGLAVRRWVLARVRGNLPRAR